MVLPPEQFARLEAALDEEPRPVPALVELVRRVRARDTTPTPVYDRTVREMGFDPQM